MATEEPLPAVEPAPEPASPEAAGENPAPKAGKSKKAKEPKAKKPPAPKKPRSPPSHPPYEEVTPPLPFRQIPSGAFPRRVWFLELFAMISDVVFIFRFAVFLFFSGCRLVCR